MNVVLIGYRGTGKTTVARLLGLKLAWPWTDADAEVELAAGKSIAAIFSDDGEPAFRELEATVVQRLVAGDRTILALGGGAVLRAATRQALRRNCWVAWLTASPETLWSRVRADTATALQRPNLTSRGGLAEIEQVLAERDSVYRECADAEIDTEGLAPEEVAERVRKQFLLAVPDHA